MKNTILFLLLGSLNLIANAQVVTFMEQPSSWEAVLEVSKAQNKPIFVDVYTEWCGPCKKMDQEVFNQKEVGTFMNQHFLSVKIDAEKGMGIQFQQNQNISSYPTYLFFDPKGDLVMTSIGFQEPSRWLKTSQKALNNYRSGFSLTKLQEEIGEDKSSEGIKNHLDMLKQLSGGVGSNIAGPLLEQYLQLIPHTELYSEETFEIVRWSISSPINLESKAIDVMIKGFHRYPIYDYNLMNPYHALFTLFTDYVDTLAHRGDKAGLEPLLALVQNEAFHGSMGTLMRDYYEVRYHIIAMDEVRYLEFLHSFAHKYFREGSDVDLFRVDELDFERTLQTRFGTTDRTKIPKDDLEHAQKGHYSYVRRAHNLLFEAMLLYRERFPSALKVHWSEFRPWLEYSITLYSNNPVYINEKLIELYDQNLKDWDAFVKNL
jgi:thiol-disulfide isomerase/thioredoxin